MRVGETKSAGGPSGSVNMGGLDVEGARGRLTIYPPPTDNPFTTLPKVLVQGETQVVLLTEREAGWSFSTQIGDGDSWNYYSCRLVDAGNMICVSGTSYLAYTRQK
jgi:hypothetical protein